MPDSAPPLIGVLSARVDKNFDTPGYYKQLASAASEKGVNMFLFSPHDVFFDQEKIRGFVPITGEPGLKYIEEMFDFPDIVMDRFRSYRKTVEDVRLYQAVRSNPNLYFVNNRLPDKWEVYNLLNQDRSVRNMLPETYLFSPTKLRYLLSKYPIVYAKPVNETGGRGILKIVRSGKNDYLLYGRNIKNRAQTKERISGGKAAQLRIRRWINDQPYLVQQGLDLSLIKDRVVDMRLLIQKVSNSDWKVTGYGMRVGGKQSATSNLHGGGKGVEAKRLLTHVFGKKKYLLIRRKFLSLSQKVSLAIEKKCGPLIELGLDIGIDTKGKVWFIEANGMPGRELFHKIRNKRLYDHAVQRPLNYLFTQYSERCNETRKED
jgi:hypothetical protein